MPTAPFAIGNVAVLPRAAVKLRPRGAVFRQLHRRSTSRPLLCSITSELSQQEEDREVPSQGLPPVAGGIVALGKFDALHIGHRELAIQAAKVGPPFLLSFVGIAEVLGWEPRLSLLRYTKLVLYHDRIELKPPTATCIQKRVKKLSYFKLDRVVATTLQTLDSAPDSFKRLVPKLR
uniref:FAD synthase n=1 Tax=Quercus lobata TaxID=97700 RepID=A0A7N2MEM6_QUELO